MSMSISDNDDAREAAAPSLEAYEEPTVTPLGTADEALALISGAGGFPA